MPRGDGTGPSGLGPNTGRGRGLCGGAGHTLFGGGRGWFWGLAAPAVAAIARDLANPSGLLRRLARGLLTRGRNTLPSHIRETEHTVIDTQRRPVDLDKQ